MVIAVDFDGTCTTHEFPHVGKDIGAAKVLKKLVKNGHHLILYTMRSDRDKGGETHDPTIKDITGTFLTDAVQWFDDNGIPLYGIQANPTQHKWTKSPKCYAQLYLDDAALGCPLKWDATLSDKPFVDWKKVERLLKKQGIL